MFAPNRFSHPRRSAVAAGLAMGLTLVSALVAEAAHVVRAVAVAEDVAPGTGGVAFESFDYTQSYLTDGGARLFGGYLALPPTFGVWLDEGGQRSLLVRGGDPVPGIDGANWGDGAYQLLRHTIDTAGRTLISGDLGAERGVVLWMDGPSGGGIVARGGQYLFDQPGYGPIELYPLIDTAVGGHGGAFNGGRVVVPAELRSDQWGSVGWGFFIADDTGTLTTIGHVIGSAGTPLPGFSDYGFYGPAAHGGSIVRPVLGPDGVAVYAIDGVSSTNSSNRLRALYRDTGGSPALLLSGAVADFDMRGLTLDDRGRVAYYGEQPGGAGLAIWIENAEGQFVRVIGPGDVPDGASAGIVDILGFSYVAGDRVALLASLDDGRDGIFLASPTESWTIALDGDPAPDTEVDTVFGARGIGHMVANDEGQIAFTADLVGPDDNGDGYPDPRGNGVFFADVAESTSLVLRTGDRIEIAPGVTRTVWAINMWGSPFAQCCGGGFTIGTGADGFPTYFNDDGDLLFGVLFFGSPEVALVQASRALIVNSRFDDDDANPGDGLCDTGNIIVGGEPECTLRAALTEANAKPGSDRVSFSFPDVEARYEIHPEQALPPVTDPVTIQGLTNAAGTPLVHMLGDGAGDAVNGFVFTGDGHDSSLRDLIVARFDGHGVLLDGVIDVHVTGCRIGTNADGAPGMGNGGDGVHIRGEDRPAGVNRIGGATPAEGNTIAGNTGNGITIAGPDARHNEVIGNTIGIGLPGGGRAANTGHGVLVVRGANETRILDNVISGNGGCGVRLESEDGHRPEETELLGNRIGVDDTGMIAIPNGQSGIALLGGRYTRIGSTSPGGNVISGNALHGVLIEGSDALLNTIRGNVIGVAIDGVTPVPNGGDGVRLAGARENTVGGGTPDPGTNLGNVLSGNDGAGVSIVGATAVENAVVGNAIGLAADGETVVSNRDGVRIEDAPANRIGGIGFDRNVITGNERDGVRVEGAAARDCSIRGNVIGLTRSGLVADGRQTGVRVLAGATQSIIGGSLTGEGNIISGNADAVRLEHPSARTRLLGNVIGLDEARSEVRANARGIVVNANSNAIGGFRSNDGNDIAGNGQFAVAIGDIDTDDARRFNGNVVLRNRIGRFADGSFVPEGQPTGVLLQGVESNLVGSASLASGNDILAREFAIDVLGGKDNLIKGNDVSTFTGLEENLGVGIRILNSTDNRIMDGNDVARCFIGILLEHSTKTRITENVIRLNDTGLHVEFSAWDMVRYNTFDENGVACYVTSDSRLNLEGNDVTGSTGTSSGLHVVSASVYASGNRFMGDAGDAIYVDGTSDVTIHANNITDNAGAGLRVLAQSANVFVTDNWWGAADGPGGDGSGSGEEVVGASPSTWRSSPVSIVTAFDRDTLSLYEGGVDTVDVFVRDWTASTASVNLHVNDPGGWIVSVPPSVVSLDAHAPARVRIPVGVPLRSLARGSDVIEVFVMSASDTVRAVLTVNMDATTPVLVGGLQAIETDGRVTLAWRAYASGFTRFEVERASGLGGDVAAFELLSDAASVEDGRWSYVDAAAGAGVHTYRVTGFLSGSVVPVGEVTVTVTGHAALALEAVRPNPVAHHATIAFSVPSEGRVDMAVFDIRGRRVRSLLSETVTAGRHERTWDGHTEDGHRVASGVYFLRVDTMAGQLVQRLLVLR